METGQDRISQIREESLRETENISFKPRFGLFTKPPPLCIHNDYDDNIKEAGYEERKKLSEIKQYRWGSSAEAKKNMSTNMPRKGKNEEVYFSVPSYVTIGDTYQDPEKLKKYGYFNGVNSRPRNITAWRQSDKKKTVIAPPYAYIPDPTKSDAALQIIIPPTGRLGEVGNKPFSSSVGRKGGTFNEFTPYEINPYDNDKEKDKIRKFRYRNKFLSGPFLTNGKFNRPFTTDTEVHDIRNFTTERPNFMQVDIDTKYGGLNRSSARLWKPSNPAKQGYNCTLNQFKHAHYGRFYKERAEVKKEDEKIWIPNSKGTGSVPNPPIVCNLRNKFRDIKSKTMTNWNFKRKSLIK